MINIEQKVEQPIINNPATDIILEGLGKGVKMSVIAAGGYLLVDSIIRNPVTTRRKFLSFAFEFIAGNTIVGIAADRIK